MQDRTKKPKKAKKYPHIPEGSKVVIEQRGAVASMSFFLPPLTEEDQTDLKNRV